MRLLLFSCFCFLPVGLFAQMCVEAERQAWEEEGGKGNEFVETHTCLGVSLLLLSPPGQGKGRFSSSPMCSEREREERQSPMPAPLFPEAAVFFFFLPVGSSLSPTPRDDKKENWNGECPCPPCLG